ncbi:MAG: hypothetical protein IIY78_08430 [Clostridia bacterium]|nr:hypothetical protein [Clostridia bacterium]
MKNMNKGVMIGTLAAALAAVTLAGCGKTVEQAANTAPARIEAAVTTSAEAAKPAEVKNKETTEKTAKAKDTKKSKNTKKSKKNSKKNTKAAEPAVAAKPAETMAPVNQNVAPVIQVTAPAPAPEAQTAQAPAAPVVEAQKPVVTEDVYPVWVDGDAYAGSYYEQSAGRATMDVTRNSDGTYSVEVAWPSSANETNYWNFSGSFDGKGNLKYTNCRKTTAAVNADGSYTYDSCGLMTPYTVYSAGSGSIKFDDHGITWNDDMGDILPGTRFVNYQPSTAVAETTYNTKADEVGTAGSSYYANEGFDTGFFYDANGSKATLQISKSSVTPGTYDVCVICPVSLGEYKTYGANCNFQAEGTLLTYDNGAVSRQVYDENGNVVENVILENGHYGHLTQHPDFIEWFDSDGNYYVFTK